MGCGVGIGCRAMLRRDVALQPLQGHHCGTARQSGAEAEGPWLTPKQPLVTQHPSKGAHLAAGVPGQMQRVVHRAATVALEHHLPGIQLPNIQLRCLAAGRNKPMTHRQGRRLKPQDLNHRPLRA